MVKEMFRLDSFYSIDASTLMLHKDYPPIISIYELFFTKLSGGYNETYLIRGLIFINVLIFVLTYEQMYYSISVGSESNKK